ncbi:unnamed protein product, partial [marine sediment metagenome]
MPNGEPFVEPKPPWKPPVEWGERREWWEKQLEEYSKQAETPMEPRSVWGTP